MSTQLNIWDNPDGKLLREFKAWHAMNPHVWDLFERYALEAVAAGHRNYGARTVIERIRWHVQVETRGDLDFKINDHHTPFYARMFVHAHPEHDGFFRNRVSAADELEATA